MPELPKLSLAEWIVLALLDEAPRHGFAVAGLTARDGELGRVWQVPRPIVYRAAGRLVELGLVRKEASEPGARGPQRSVLAVTATGSPAVRRWLTAPVRHVRDARSELVVKLALLQRRKRSTRALIAAQRKVFVRIERALIDQQESAEGFDEIVAVWRTESVRAAMRFLDALSG